MMCVCICAHWCPTLCNPMDCNTPGSSVDGIIQARILKWIAISFSRGSSPPSDQTRLSCVSGIQGGFFFFFFTRWVTREAPISNDILLYCFPGSTSGKEPACQCRKHKRCGFSLWVGKIPWRWKWQATLVFLPRKSHEQGSLASYSSWGYKELNTI